VLLDEIKSEAWHILAYFYTYQRMAESAPKCATRYELANNIIATNAISEMIIIRLARLSDKTKGTRSISMFLKQLDISKRNSQTDEAAKKFLLLSEPIVRIRHEEIAHMRPGVLSSYPLSPLPTSAHRATEALINFIDLARGELVAYIYSVGSLEPQIDLRTSLASGNFVTV
jgi:hypothetical protein